MSKVEVNQVTQQCGTTLTVGGGACKTAVVDATTVTLGRCGGTVSLASGATQSGFGRTGTVDWITTPKVTGDSPVTGVTGKGYFLNTTAGTITINLPAGAAGSIVSMADYAGTWQTYNVTVSPNGSDKIGGINAATTLETEGQSVTFVYVDGTQGWINTMDSTSNVRGNPYIVATGGDAITTCGNFKTHIFTGPGALCVSIAAASAPDNIVDYFVVGGGGGGSGGAGGAGGFRLFSTAPGCNSPLNGYASPTPSGTAVTVSATPYPIAVGGGGPTTTASGPGYCVPTASPGVASSFSTITSAGGGSGGSFRPAPNPGCEANGGDGGSGGSGAYLQSGGALVPGGTGNTPSVTPAQGTDGGTGQHVPGVFANAGSSGGAAVAGINGAPGVPLPGGAGSYIADPFVGPTAPSYGEPGPVGSTRYFAGGGGGSGSPGNPPHDGGVGGGGNKINPGPQAAGNGVVNTGGGAGACWVPCAGGGTGGSGIVMIRYRYQ